MDHTENADSSPKEPQSHDLRRTEHVRVRKRIRVKKKKSPKKKLAKFFERVMWVFIVVAFILTLFYLLNELDLSDKRYKKKVNLEIIPRNLLNQNVANRV